MSTAVTHRTHFRFLLAALVIASVPLHAQSTGHNYSGMTVDVVAVDSGGQPVKGLRQEDFRIVESKKPQQIRTFEFHEQQPKPDSAPLQMPGNTFTNAGSNADAKPITVVLLDQMNTTMADQELAQQEITKFFQSRPDASFALVSIRSDNVACRNLGVGAWTIPSTVDISWDPSCTARGKLIYIQGITDKNESLLAAATSSLAQPHSTFYRTNLAKAFSPPSPPRHRSLLVRFFGGDVVGPPRQEFYDIGPTESTDTSMATMAELGGFLEGLPGRKNLVWLAGSFDAGPVPLETDHLFVGKFKGWQKADPFSAIDTNHLAADRLALARVAVYPVDLTGKNKDIEIHHYCDIGYFGAPADPGTTVPGVCVLHGIKVDQIARYSGGRSFHGRDSIQQALTQAVADNNAYYTLTYSPTDPKFNSKVRKLRIEVDRPDITLIYRDRYFADNPALVTPSDQAAVTEVNVLNPVVIGNPWRVMRVPHIANSEADDPIQPALHFGIAGFHDLLFEVHLGLSGKPEPATPEQMAHFAMYESFEAERIAKAMANLTTSEKKSEHHGRILLDTFPDLDPEMLDPYVIRYSMPGDQLATTTKQKDKLPINLEIVLVAYDAMGKKVTGLKTEAQGTLSAPEASKVISNGFHIEQKIKIPERATTIRIAVRNVLDNKMGSLEIPLWAVSSPYKRKPLPFPTELTEIK